MADSKSDTPKGDTQGKTPKPTEENTSRAKLLRMGQPSGLEPKGKPTTKW